MDTHTPTTPVPRWLAGLALCLAATSAMAESMEYRRGYEQGYRDGQAAQHRPQPSRRIVIEEALYGARQSWCDARDVIQRQIGHHQRTEIEINNSLCGDPLPNQVKRLSIKFRCDNGPVEWVGGREGGALILDCRRR